MFKRNCPFNFADMVNLVLEHPNTNYLDKTGLRLGLDMFDFDLEKMNSDKLLVERPVFLNEVLDSEKTGYDSFCYFDF